MFWALVSAATPLPAAAQAPADEPVQVEFVIDGDTVALADRRHVRLIGINAPELGHPCRAATPACTPTTDEPLAREARQQLQSLVAHKPVTLVTGAETHDRYGRVLAHLQLPDGADPEDTLLRRGLASVIAVPPNVDRLTHYQTLEAEARRRHRGLWADPYFAPRAADQIAPGETGYRFVRGRISRIGHSRKYVYLDLGPRLSIMIARTDWERYFGYPPETLRQHDIEVRGWIASDRDRLHLRVQHPAMLNLNP